MDQNEMNNQMVPEMNGTPMQGTPNGFEMNGTPMQGTPNGFEMNGAPMQGTPNGPAMNGAPMQGIPNGPAMNGAPMGGYQYQQNPYQPYNMKPKKSKKKWFIFGGIGFAAVVVTFVILTITIFIPMSNYNNAKEAFDDKDYKKANELFKKAGSYKDAKEQADKSMKAYNYSQAEDYIEDGKYEDAIECYKEAEGYEDADKKLISTYMLLGEYRTAYDESPDELKDSVLFQNFVAYFCSNAKENLKNPESFELRDAWWDESRQRMIMEIGGENSYGAMVTNYWYYYLPSDENEYSLYASISDLEKEEYYSWDDTETTMEKFVDNVARDVISETISDDDLKIDSNIVSQMNDMKEAGYLEDITLIDEANQKYCGDNESF